MQPAKLVSDSLLAAYKAVREGGDSLKSMSGPQMDITTRADIEAGRAILDKLRGIVAYSEEHGMVGDIRSSKFSAVFDEIDATLNFREGLGMLPHGSIIGIFGSPRPRFRDCLASGFLEFNSGNLFHAERGMGTRLVEGWTEGGGMERLVRTSGRKGMEGQALLRIVPDLYSLGGLGGCLASYAGSAWLADFRSSALHLVLVASGAIDIFITGDNFRNPKKKKTGEEIGPGYLMLKESGGALLDWSGNDIGNEEIGLDRKRTFHVIAASTENLGREFAEDMRRLPGIREYMRRRGL